MKLLSAQGRETVPLPWSELPVHAVPEGSLPSALPFHAQSLALAPRTHLARKWKVIMKPSDTEGWLEDGQCLAFLDTLRVNTRLKDCGGTWAPGRCPLRDRAAWGSPQGARGHHCRRDCLLCASPLRRAPGLGPGSVNRRPFTHRWKPDFWDRLAPWADGASQT